MVRQGAGGLTGDSGIRGHRRRGIGVEELKGTEAKLWVPLVREEMAGGGRSMADRDAAAEALVGGGAPVVDGRREAVGKMRKGEAELLEGLG